MSTPTSKRHRSFSVKSSQKDSNANPVEPITFDLLDKTFTAKPVLQGIVLLEFLESAVDGDVKSIIAFKTILKEALGEEEYARFYDTLKNAEDEVDLAVLAEIVTFLVEEYSSRPTEAS